MSTRAYDYKLSIADTSSFEVGNTIIGLSSNVVAQIIDVSDAELKVKLANTSQQYIIGENVISNVAILRSYNAFIDHSSNISGASNVFVLPLTYGLINQNDAITVYVDNIPAPRDSYVINANNTIQFLPVESLDIRTTNTVTTYSDIRTAKIFPDSNVSSLLIQAVTGNTEADSFVSANFEGTLLSAESTILDINDSPYIAEKNAVTQSPVVKLYSIYYPGEWYPPNNAGNPSGSGSGFPWPYGFPIRYAEILGDEYYNTNPAAVYGGTTYPTTAIESDNIQIDASGKIGEISLSISNFDGSISALVENKNILGYNSTRSTQAIVNGELVQNIDPRTVSSNIFFSSSVQASRGENAAWDYESTISAGDTWTPLRSDSRDLTGAVVDIVVTYAKFLDYWPEYGIIRSATSNSANVSSSSVYRVGDIVTSNTNSNVSSILKIEGDTVYFSNTSLNSLTANNPLYIVNPDADSSAHIKHTFVINSLDELDEIVAKFSLTNWLQYFKNTLPKRKFYPTTCPFVYKGEQCKYPASGTGAIVSSNPTVQANGFFTFGNVSTDNIAEDICSKTLTACRLRKNLVNFGGFPNAQ